MQYPKNKYVRLGIVGIFVVICLITGFVMISRQLEIREVRQKRAEAASKSEDVLDSRISALKSAGLISRELAKSKIDNCSVQPSKSLGDPRTQSCSLIYVIGFETPMDSKGARNAIASSQNIQSSFEKGTNKNKSSGCEVYGPTLVFREAIEQSSWIEPKCPIPPRSVNEQPKWQVSYVGYDTQPFYTFEKNNVPTNKNSIWITYEQLYYVKDLIFWSSAPKMIPL